MQLELGAGYRPTPGFVHNDARPGEDIEIVWPAETISQCPEVGPESCTTIRATHLLEHFSYRKSSIVLREWWDCLQPGGEVYIEVPNLTWQTHAHARGEITDSEVVNYLYGEQDYPGNFHYTGFTEYTLDCALTDAGFIDVRIQDIGQVLIAWGRKEMKDGVS